MSVAGSISSLQLALLKTLLPASESSLKTGVSSALGKRRRATGFVELVDGSVLPQAVLPGVTLANARLSATQSLTLPI